MRLGIAIFLQCLAMSVFANFDHMQDEPVLAAMEGEPSVSINKSINPISGDYVISETDLIVPGYEPLYFNRTYLSSIQKGRNAHWSLLPHIYMYFTVPDHKKKEPLILTVSEPSGSTIRYKNLVADNGKDRKQFFPMLGTSTRGITNTARGEIGAHTNIAHNKIVLDKSQDAYVMTTCDGTQRYYKKPSHTLFAYLEKERKPNGNWIRYEYNEDYYTLREIRTTNPQNTKIYAKVVFENETPNPHNCKNFSVLTEKKERLHYYFHLDDVKNGKHNDHYFRLNCIVRPHLPEEKLSYQHVIDKESSFLINERCLDGKVVANIKHYSLDHNENPAGLNTIHNALDPRLRRIHSIKEPVAADGSLVCTHYFTYNLGNYALDKKNQPTDYLDQIGYTYCYDAYNKKTEYAFNGFFVPLHTFKFGVDLNNPKDIQQKTLFGERFYWNFDGLLNRLSHKSYENSEKTLLLKHFKYDTKGNILEESIVGNLSGHNHHLVTLPEKTSSDIYTIKNTYSDTPYSLITSKTLPSGKSYYYEYLPNTNLISAIFTLYDNHIKQREFKVYNDDHVVIETIIDDGNSHDRNNLEGVTRRTLTSIQPKPGSPAINFPEVIEEKHLDLKTNTYHLLKKVVLHYSNECSVIQEDIYDITNKHVYSIYNTYDYRQRLVQSTDSLGRSSSFTYNNFNHLVEETLGNTALKITHSTDILGREFCVSTTDSKGLVKETKTVYDLKSRVAQTKDFNGNLTIFSYDDLDHEIERVLPATFNAHQNATRPTIKTINDVYGHPLSITDPLGHVTRFTYSALGKPTSIIYPDNTEELFNYNLDGTLAFHQSVTGLKTYFKYDYQGRVLKKLVFSKTRSFLYEESFTYDAFNLLSHIDEKGVKTLYRYDGAGRKIEESKSKDNEFIGREEYAYDNLGRHYKTLTHSDNSSHHTQMFTQVCIKLFDDANRLIEERQEDASGALFSKVQYQYDQYDNTTSIITYINEKPSIETFTYDDYKRVTSHKDPEGNISYTKYIDRILNSKTHSYDSEKIHIDPKGRQTKERYSATSLLLSITFCNPLGITEAEELFYYDVNGNKIKQLSKIFAHQELLKEVTTVWEYDSRNRVVTQIEAYGDPLQKVSRFTYTADGKEKSITQPSGITINTTYDDLGNAISLKSSDGSIHYQFTYNKAGDLVEEINAITKSRTRRIYNARGNLVEETLANGLLVKKNYDDFGRKTSLTLHDNTKIEYTFDSFHLKKISKHTPDGTLHYEHKYLAYNLGHQPTEESSIFNLCSITKTYDVLGRNTGIITPYYSEHVDTFDSCGNLIELHTESAFNTTSNNYTYDELDHVIEEKGLSNHKYAFDSHHNRITKDCASYNVNSLNQLLKEQDACYTYTPNGNRSLKKVNEKELIYEYDALNRLVALKNDSILIVFTYDSWHRRLSKSIKKKSFFGFWNSIYQEYYVYDDEKEIAATDSSFAIHQLRILGLGKGGDIGAAVAVEINHTPYIPSHDLFGNVVNLIQAEKNYVSESYRYNAFGECKIYDYYHYSIKDSSINNPWRYQSKRTDDESGLIFFGRRYYDPKVGSWISPDPLGLTQGPNLYQFLLGNPFANIDLYGLAALERDDEEPYNTRPTTGGGFNNFYNLPNDSPYENVWLKSPYNYQIPQRTDIPRTISASSCYSSNNFHQGTGYSNNQNYSFVFINGIDTSLDEARQMANSCAKNLNHNVNLLYNPTNGPIKDLIKVGLNHLRRPSHVVQELKQYLTYEINRGREVFLFAHSGGGGISCNILEGFTPYQRNRINVITFGSAKYIPKGFAKTATNYLSTKDWVSKGSDFWNFSLNYHEFEDLDTRTYAEVTFLQPTLNRTGRQEHAFMGSTYQRALENECEFIRETRGF